jgi:glucokinase
MTNHPAWAFSIAELKRELKLERLLVLNDFTTLALSLPVLKPEDLRQVGGSAPVEGAPIALIGPGTGLGAGGLIAAAHGRGATPIAGEGGHVTLAACDEHEAAVVEHLRKRFGHASAERAVSGQGIENLYEACCALAGVKPQALEAADISAHAIAGTDKQCGQAIDLFFSFLGTTAGNLALTLGAHGGVYIGGGITAKLGQLIEGSKLRERFEAKGRFHDYMTRIPLFVIDAKFPPALTGAARAFDALD